MKPGEMARTLTNVNPWWRDPAGWEDRDPALVDAAGRALDYRPAPLGDIAPGGLYVLRGPRRVGKSVELKRSVAVLIRAGVNPRHIIHYPCDRLTAEDLGELESTGRVLTGTDAGPRWWLLDEVSAISDGWPAAVKWLRDNTALRGDCVVLTGSSSRDLADAQKELAGRRGTAARSDRFLMPMGFQDFARAASAGVRDAPTHFLTLAELADRARLRDAVHALVPWLSDLVGMWDLYLQVGGYPTAVADWIEHGRVGPGFVEAIWDVIHGDAFRVARVPPARTQGMLEGLSRRLGNPVGDLPLAREVGFVDSSGRPDGRQSEGRLMDLEIAFTVWRCHQVQRAHLTPNLRAFAKTYFTDPLLAQIAHFRNPVCTLPDPTLLTEQQIGRALALAHEVQRPGSLLGFSNVMYATNASRTEIDFVGPGFGGVGVDGKYVDHGLSRPMQTMRSHIASGRIASGLLATRREIRVDEDEPVWGVPAAILAWVLPGLTAV